MLLIVPVVIKIIDCKKKKKRKILKNKIDKSLKNKKLTDENLNELLKWCKENKISEDQFNKIYGEKARIIIQAKILNIINDFIYTPKEEEELKELAKNLKINLSDDISTDMNLSSIREAYKIKQSNKLPVDNSCPIILQQKEVCHFQTSCNFYEEKKGEMYFIDCGTLHLTNKRIIFEGDVKTKMLTYQSLVNCDITEKGIRIKKTNQSRIIIYIPYNYADMGIFKVIIDKIWQRS